MANYPIEDIEGIGEVLGAKLREAGVKDTDALLAKCKTPKDRESLAAASGIEAKRILKFANMADLYRVKGIGSEYSELLEAAGVDTVVELSTRSPANLAAKLAEVNEQKKLTRRVPDESMCTDWVAHAKTLSRAIEY
jgi:predicted flap endonuclease-1-like 5' DNA nuclease